MDETNMKLAKMDPNIEHALKAAIQSDNDEQRKGRLNTTFHASSLGMCPKKQILTRANVKPDKPISSTSLFKMRIGSVIHKDTQGLLEKYGYILPEWTEKRAQYRSVSCRIDGYTLHVKDGAILEIKTTDDKAFQYDFSESYFWQGFFNCIAFDVPNLLLFQLGKNQGLARHRVFPMTEKWNNIIDKHIDELDNMWRDYELDGSTPEHKHRYKWEDRFCPYK